MSDLSQINLFTSQEFIQWRYSKDVLWKISLHCTFSVWTDWQFVLSVLFSFRWSYSAASHNVSFFCIGEAFKCTWFVCENTPFQYTTHIIAVSYSFEAAFSIFLACFCWFATICCYCYLLCQLVLAQGFRKRENSHLTQEQLCGKEYYSTLFKVCGD